MEGELLRKLRNVSDGFMVIVMVMMSSRKTDGTEQMAEKMAEQMATATSQEAWRSAVDSLLQTLYKERSCRLPIADPVLDEKHACASITACRRRAITFLHGPQPTSSAHFGL